MKDVCVSARLISLLLRVASSVHLCLSLPLGPGTAAVFQRKEPGIKREGPGPLALRRGLPAVPGVLAGLGVPSP